MESNCPVNELLPMAFLHHASDWVLQADLGSNYCFAIHIAFTQLRPDITISHAFRKVTPIEVTYPCEQNMESWHSTSSTYFS